MAISEEKIKTLLGSGLSNEVVASAVGCTASYISQLLADPVFASEVTELKVSALSAHTARDLSLDSIEDTLIEKVAEALQSGTIYKPLDLVTVLSRVNMMKRRGIQQQAAPVVHRTVVTLIHPERMTHKFITNKHNEVIEVDEQTLVAMPASTLLQRLAASNKEAGNDGQAKRYAEVGKFLPGTFSDAKVISSDDV